jgi:hypothetical protein
LLPSKGNTEVDARHLTFLQLTQDNAHEQNNTWGGRGGEKLCIGFFFFIFSFFSETKGEKLRGCCFVHL